MFGEAPFGAFLVRMRIFYFKLASFVAMEYNKYTTEFIKKAIKDSYKRLIAPAIEREIRTILTDVAEDKSIKVFKKNLEQLLMQPPIRNKVVLGWDPAFRTGCKLAVIDEYGKVLDTSVVYPTQPQNKITETNIGNFTITIM